MSSVQESTPVTYARAQCKDKFCSPEFFDTYKSLNDSVHIRRAYKSERNEITKFCEVNKKDDAIPKNISAYIESFYSPVSTENKFHVRPTINSKMQQYEKDDESEPAYKLVADLQNWDKINNTETKSSVDEDGSINNWKNSLNVFEKIPSHLKDVTTDKVKNEARDALYADESTDKHACFVAVLSHVNKNEFNLLECVKFEIIGVVLVRYKYGAHAAVVDYMYTRDVIATDLCCEPVRYQEHFRYTLDRSRESLKNEVFDASSRVCSPILPLKAHADYEAAATDRSVPIDAPSSSKRQWKFKSSNTGQIRGVTWRFKERWSAMATNKEITVLESGWICSELLMFLTKGCSSKVNVENRRTLNEVDQLLIDSYYCVVAVQLSEECINKAVHASGADTNSCPIDIAVSATTHLCLTELAYNNTKGLRTGLRWYELYKPAFDENNMAVNGVSRYVEGLNCAIFASNFTPGYEMYERCVHCSFTNIHNYLSVVYEAPKMTKGQSLAERRMTLAEIWQRFVRFTKTSQRVHEISTYIDTVFTYNNNPNVSSRTIHDEPPIYPKVARRARQLRRPEDNSRMRITLDVLAELRDSGIMLDRLLDIIASEESVGSSYLDRMTGHEGDDALPLLQQLLALKTRT